MDSPIAKRKKRDRSQDNSGHDQSHTNQAEKRQGTNSKDFPVKKPSRPQGTDEDFVNKWLAQTGTDAVPTAQKREKSQERVG
jgi:hypothetical protein